MARLVYLLLLLSFMFLVSQAITADSKYFHFKNLSMRKSFTHVCDICFFFLIHTKRLTKILTIHRAGSNLEKF